MEKTPLRVLVVEDSQADFDLLLLELERGNHLLRTRRVETAESMREALAGERWDLVISDFVLPAFSATAALSVLAESGLDIPFLVVSGTINEDIAVDALKAGAHDFMTKNRLARLLPAIERELGDAKRRAGQRAAELERKQVEAPLLIADRMVSVGTLAAGVANVADVPAVASTPSPRRGKVLVIDDELLIAKAVERLLGREHDVASELQAQRALDRIVAGERFDVILCDLMMPEMTGMEFHTQLARLVPEQIPAVIFLTGGAFTPRARDFLDETASPRIDKPFDSASLREVVSKRVR